MELHAVQTARGGGHSCYGTGGCRSNVRKSRWQFGHQIAMTHPDLLPLGKPGEQRRSCPTVQLERRQSEFAPVALLNDSAQQMRHELLPVTDAQHRLIVAKNRGVNGGA